MNTTHEPRIVPLVATACVAFMALTLGTHGLPLLPAAALSSLVAGIAALLIARTHGNTAPLSAWLVLLLAVPVATRLMALAASWDVALQTAPLAGALVGFYAYAGWLSASQPVERVAIGGAWAELAEEARSARKGLIVELKGHALEPAMVRALQDESARLVGSVERTASTWWKLERSASPTLHEQVRVQHQTAIGRAQHANDDVTARDHQRTADALGQQLASLERIRRSSERAMARVRCQVTLMETARLAVMAFAAQDAGLQLEEAQRLARELETASDELDLSAGALEEVTTADSARSPHPAPQDPPAQLPRPS